RLGGPPGTYVGHRLMHDSALRAAAASQSAPRDLSPTREKKLLLLPGSRRSEVSGLIGIFGEALAALNRRGHRLKVLMPTVPHVAEAVTSATADWETRPDIILDPARKWKAFGEADAAM